MECGSENFYDSSVPLRTVTPSGTWMYLPHGQPDPSSPSTSTTSKSSRTSRRRRRRKPPSNDPDGGQGSEFPDSEAMTYDPLVDPADPPPQPSPLLPGSPARHGDDPEDHDLPRSGRSRPSQGRRTLQTSQSSSMQDWNSRKGPEPGIRWRLCLQPGSMIAMILERSASFRRRSEFGRSKCSLMQRRKTRRCFSTIASLVMQNKSWNIWISPRFTMTRASN